MQPDPEYDEQAESPWAWLTEGWRWFRARHTVSFFLLLIVIAVLALSTQLIQVRDNPKRFGFVLILLFVFFFVVILRALVDAIEILRGHFSEREKIYRSTLGDKEFVDELGRRLSDKEGDS